MGVEQGKRWARKGHVQSLMGIRVLKVRVDFGYLWQLKSTGIEGVMGLTSKTFDKSFQNCSYNKTNMQPQCLFKYELRLRLVMSEMLAKCLPCKGHRVVYEIMKESEDLEDNHGLLFINLHQIAITAANSKTFIIVRRPFSKVW